MYLVPGDPVKLMLGDSATEEEIQYQRNWLGLNDPYMVQLGRFLYDTFIKFDFGTSITMKVNVMEEMSLRLPRTLWLSVLCVVIDLIVGIPLGIMAATHRGGARDQGLMIFSILGVSIPNFWLALLLVILLSVQLRWLPPYGIGTWKHWIMPVIAGAVAGIAQIARQTRSSVLETIRADFVTTARSKGLEERKVIYKHMLPNAMIPIVHTFAEHFTRLIGGMVVIETVFSFPGIGTFMVQAISARDYPVVRACVLILAIFSAIVVLLADLIYGFIDPRIKAQYADLSAKKGGVKI
jgi:peptide/nickel transport system permease protein